MTRIPPTIDMLPDGSFRNAQARPVVPLSMKLALAGALVVVLGGALTIAALAIWVVSMLLPVIIVAGAVAWGAWKYRRWQLLRGQGNAGQGRPGQPGFFRQ